VISDTVKFSIVQIEKPSTGTPSTDAADWDVAGKIKSVSFTTVPMAKLSGISFKDVTKQKINTVSTTSTVTDAAITGTAGTRMDTFDNAEAAGYTTQTLSNTPVAATAVDGTTGHGLTVTGTYGGNTLRVPTGYYTLDTTSISSTKASIATDDLDAGQYYITGVADAALKYSDLYDVNTTHFSRKDASLTLKANVFEGYDTSGTHSGGSSSEISTEVKFSDEGRQVTSIAVVDEATLKATNTTLTINDSFKICDYETHSTDYPTAIYGYYHVLVKDQYGKVLTSSEVSLTYTVSGLVESTGDLTHKTDSLVASKNGTNDAALGYAELGDAFTLEITATSQSSDKTVLVGSVTSDKIAVTVGSDSKAYISSKESTQPDETLRKTYLGYDR
jgi:hypothetical protein